MITLLNFTAHFHLLATLLALASFATQTAALPKSGRGGGDGSAGSGGGDSGIPSDNLTDGQIAGIVIGCVSALVLLWLGIAAWKSAKRKKTIEYERARIAEEGDSVPYAIIVQKQDAAVEAMKKKKKSRGHWLNNWEWF
ncbi:hypothetical protein FPQ18DRAFT_324334 [Pyronema domesticum]|uniref:Uncharacterized protein n=1 Tax=Pyronema omphalodes (strain CBS 100304) TaxID=1076935 RepID=U4L3Y9_PYROM|nr:hypothetical protein FPQ18DRAFT_324334 [Pyronema domesticum]CCX07023.1 Protein of unknown function [Pyronema omphalodes CBS 100304]